MSFGLRLGSLAILTSVVLLSSCQTVPDDAFRLSESSLAMRNMQTRVYSSVDDASILSASTAVLQDMGYAIDEVEYQLGVVSASKRADATNKMQALGSLTLDSVKCAFTFFMACDGEHYGELEDVQDIRLTLISMPRSETNRDVTVRVTIQRVIWDKKGRLAEQSTVLDSEVYDSLFVKLSKAVFLEQEGL